MSTLVGFYGSREGQLPGKSEDKKNSNSSVKPAPILPETILLQLQHRRVTVLLSTRLEEIEGTLVKVDEERGDVFLEDATHYQWDKNDVENQEKKVLAENKVREEGSSSTEVGDKKKICNEGEDSFTACHGGGKRREIRSSKSMMIQSRYIDLITPTLFGSK